MWNVFVAFQLLVAIKAIQTIRDTLGGWGSRQCHQMTHGEGEGQPKPTA
jgi:hypothetical protein